MRQFNNEGCIECGSLLSMASPLGLELKWLPLSNLDISSNHVGFYVMIVEILECTIVTIFLEVSFGNECWCNWFLLCQIKIWQYILTSFNSSSKSNIVLILLEPTCWFQCDFELPQYLKSMGNMKPKFYVLNNFNIQWLPNISHPQNQIIQFMNKI
jgi:hypothetical protein